MSGYLVGIGLGLLGLALGIALRRAKEHPAPVRHLDVDLYDTETEYAAVHPSPWDRMN